MSPRSDQPGPERQLGPAQPRIPRCWRSGWPVVRTPVETRVRRCKAVRNSSVRSSRAIFDIALLGYPGPTAGGPNGDPDSLRGVFSSHGPPSLTGASGYSNPAFEALAQQQRMTFEVGQRKALVAKMQKIIADDVPILPLFYPEVFLAYRKSVLDRWYFTPGEYPATEFNKQLFITGKPTGTTIGK